METLCEAIHEANILALIKKDKKVRDETNPIVRQKENRMIATIFFIIILSAASFLGFMLLASMRFTDLSNWLLR